MTAVWLRVTTVISVLAVWMVIITLMPIILGFTESTFFSFGPNTTVAFFGMRVDTWPRWVFIIVYIVINQILQTYGLETITPWMINEIQNKKVKHMSMSPLMTQLVLGLWTIYLWSGRLFGLQVMISQIDFLICVLISDLFATALVTQMYIREKKANEYAVGDDGLDPLLNV